MYNSESKLYESTGANLNEARNKEMFPFLKRKQNSSESPLKPNKTMGNFRRIKAVHCSAGKWTKEEHDMLLFALDIFGNNWIAIKSFLGTRSTQQIRSHAQKFFKAVRRAEIKKLKDNNELEGKIFIATKQYRNNPNRWVISKGLLKQIEDSKRLWFSLKEKSIQDSKVAEAQKEEFNLPPLGNIADDGKKEVHLQEIQKLELIPSLIPSPQQRSQNVLESAILREYNIEFYGLSLDIIGRQNVQMREHDEQESDAFPSLNLLNFNGRIY